MMIMTSVKWQFAAMKLCALLKKPELGGTFVAILMKTKKYVYECSMFMFFRQRKEAYLTACVEVKNKERLSRVTLASSQMEFVQQITNS